MCPMCLSTAALIAGSVTSTGGFAAIVIRKFSVRNAVKNHPAPTPSELFQKKNVASEIVLNSPPGRNQDVNEH